MEKFLIGSSTIYGLKKKPDLEKFATQSDIRLLKYFCKKNPL